MVARSKGLGPEKDCAGEGQQHIQMTDPSSRQRGRPTKQDRNSQTIRGSTPRLADWPTVSRNVTLTLTLKQFLHPCGGGFEYFHCDPASRRRRQKGKSQIWDSKIWSRVQRDYNPRKTMLARASIIYLYVVILPCILVTTQQHVLSFLCVCF
jgi:hypothetical protein